MDIITTPFPPWKMKTRQQSIAWFAVLTTVSLLFAGHYYGGGFPLAVHYEGYYYALVFLVFTLQLSLSYVPLFVIAFLVDYFFWYLLFSFIDARYGKKKRKRRRKKRR